MKVSMICFSRKGYGTGQKLLKAFLSEGIDADLSAKSKDVAGSVDEGVRTWTGSRFSVSDVLIFIGACGIAVRSIAPYIKDKKTDPAVLCADENGNYVISLLSGHLGGANAFAEKTAKFLDAMPVITTATDIHGKFSVDEFARKNHCKIFPMDAVKRFSAELLAGKPVGFCSDFPLDGEFPDGLILYPDCSREKTEQETADPQADSCVRGAALTVHTSCLPFHDTVTLVPKCVVAGIGCRRGQTYEMIRSFFYDCLKESQIYPESISCIASIDRKKDEKGIITLARELDVPFVTFPPDALLQADGDFPESGFVRSVTGVGNVCERSAVLASGGGRLLMRKKAGNGVTCALACRDWRGTF